MPNPPISFRMPPEILDKVDMLAAEDDRDRSYFLKKLIGKGLEAYETENGTIEVDRSKVEDFRGRTIRDREAGYERFHP